MHSIAGVSDDPPKSPIFFTDLNLFTFITVALMVSLWSQSCRASWDTLICLWDASKGSE